MTEPYDQALATASASERQIWSKHVLAQIGEAFPTVPDVFEVHAGGYYRDFGLVADLRELGAKVDVPALGLAQGEQLAFYARRQPYGEGPTADRKPARSSQARVSGSYDKLTLQVKGSSSPVVLSFAELEHTLGRPLPASARRHRAWWTNNDMGHSHALAWLTAGWRVGAVDLNSARVRFER